MRAIYVFSLSAFWVRRIEVLNRGFGGYNSRWGLKILNGAVVAARPDIVIIFFGANDAVDPQVPQSVPLEEYTSNLREMILRVRLELPATTIILMTPPVMVLVAQVYGNFTTTHRGQLQV